MYWSLLWGSLVQKSFSHQIETHRSTKNFLGGQTKNTWAKILTYYGIYFLKKSKYRKFKNPKISHIFDKKLVLSIIYDKCNSNDEKIFKEEESIEILKILGLVNNTNE